MFKRVTGLTLVLMVFVLGCKLPGKEITPEEEEKAKQALLADFEQMLKSHETCDLIAFREYHTQKANGAFEALTKILDPSMLDPKLKDIPLNDRGALWMCTLAKLAKFNNTEVEPLAVAVNVQNGTAKVFFKWGGTEYGFPMARQNDKWRSPFPGHVFFVHEYKKWLDTVKENLPDDQARNDFPDQLAHVIKLLTPFQPNWAEFPEMKSDDSD